MEVTIDNLKKAIKSLNYKWFEDQINMIGIRSNLNVPDLFNDPFIMVYKKGGVEQMFVATITTEPGVYYQKNLLNQKGCAVMKPGQYINAYKPGYHKNDKTHRALIQVGKVTVCRDNDKDGVAETVGFVEDTGYHGCNIHGGKKLVDLTEIIGPNSAGCQVHARWSKKEEMCDIADLYKDVNNGFITYTLLTEKEFSKAIYG